jgi:pimeloyl-ACP methyl ester carboxylesterase
MQYPMTRLIRTLSAAIALYGTAAWGQPDDSLIAFENCELTLPGTTWTAPARCGSHRVAENPADLAGRQIDLHVAVVPAARRDARPDPLFLFAGGPGQAASEAYVMLRWVLDDIREQRDIVLIDQRGTGRSHPLDCEIDETESLDTSVDTERIREMTGECLATLDADPRFYTTSIAMRDYDEVRAALGYERINLLGISYGTRAAQVYYRSYPERVRSMILDGAVPMRLVLGAEHGPKLDRAVAAILDDCQRVEACRSRFPVSMTDVRQLMDELRETPREIRFVHPLTGEEQDLRVHDETLAVAIRFLSYQAESQATLPLLLHEATAAGDLRRLAAQAMMIMGQLTSTISRGMELSVICSEDIPWLDRSVDAGETLLGDVLLQVMRSSCEIWPRGEVAEDFRAAVSGDVPVLLLSGSRDPVTPPSYADELSEYFPRHVHLVAEGRGHSVISHFCMRNIAQRFIESADPAALDTDCVGDIEAAPFFTNLLGPGP